MSISYVEVITEASETLTLPLQDPSGGYYITDITGLDPVAADIVSTSYGTADGAQYQSARRDPRNIVMKLGFNPDYVATSMRQLRWKLYQVCMPKTKVTLKFYMNDDTVLEIAGRVETLESALFSRKPEASISIICFDPDFKAAETTYTHGSTVADTSLDEIEYEGTMPTGIVFWLFVDRNINTFMIHMEDSNGNVEEMNVTLPLVANDILEVSTVPGNKHVRKITPGSSESVLWAMDASSSWVKLQNGTNNIRVVTSGAPIDYQIEYVARYGGL